MQGTDTSVLVPQLVTSGKLMTSRRASSGVVSRMGREARNHYRHATSD